MRITLPILVAAALCAALPARAQWYAGLAAGVSEARLDTGGTTSQLADLGFLDPATSVNERDSTFRVHVGRQLGRYFAVELGYAMLGRFDLVSDVSPPGRLTSAVESSGADLSVLAMLPLNRVSLFARGGAFWSRTETQFSGTGSVVVFPAQAIQEKTSTGWVWGAGAMFNYSPETTFRLEYARYDKLEDDVAVGKFKVDTLTVGFNWRF